MQQFRKRPVVIEAMQYTELDRMWVLNWINKAKEEARFVIAQDDSTLEPQPQLWIETLEGTMKANPGDWIIRGVQGEFYPCKPDIFEATYESVES